MNGAKLCGNDITGKRISIVLLAALIGVSSATTLLAQTPTLRDALQTDSDGNSKTNAGDRLRYTLTFTNTSGATLTNVLISVPAITNTTLDGAATSATPLARDEGPIAASVPGNAFHTAFNTPLAVNDGDADEDLLNNDFLGASAAAIATFGGGTLGGAVSDNNAGATADPGGVGAHSLTVNANGSFTYTPEIGFAGLFTFQYRLANASGSDTATVTIAVGERPGPVADARAVTGNVQIDTATGTPFSVLSNDDGDGVTINVITAGTLGAVNMSANGQFLYTPPRGKSTGTDTFSYTLSNGFGTSTPATVTLNFDGNIVWFIDVAAGAGDGRSHLPYNTLAAFNTVNNGAANNPADNHVILLRDGTYANNVAGGALVLRNGQRVIGDGWSGTFLAAAGFSLAAHNLVAAFSATDPVIQNSTGHGIALLSGNHLRGLTVGNTPSGFGYSGAAVGTPVIAECSKTGTGGAISITTSGSFASSVSFDTLESTSSTGHNLSLTNVTGTLGVASAATGLAGSAANSAAVNISGGSVSLTYPGTVAKANAGSLVNVSGGHTNGTLTFNGTLSATGGDGLQFNNADGVYNFNATVTLNGGDAGVDIINGSSGNFSFTDTDITGPSGAAFLVSTSTGGSIGHAGTITKNNAGRAVDIQGKTGGSVTFNGTISQNNAASTGIFLNGNTGGTISFFGAITLTTGNNAAFTATGGGTVTATASGSTLNSGNGTALNVANTTIGASGLNFQSISSSGGSATGIILDNTGASGGLTVNGDGSNTSLGGNSSGGTIANKTGSDGATTTGCGIYLNNTANVVLRRMTINGINQNFGIRGFSVNNFTLEYSTVGSPTPTVASSIAANLQGTATGGIGEGAIYFGNQTDGQIGITGVATFTSDNISAGRSDNMQISNGGGALNRLNITGCTFGYNSFALPSANAALTVVARRASSGNTVLNSTVSGNTFVGSPGNAANFTGQEPTTSLGIAMDTIFRNNNISNNHTNNNIGGCNLTIAGFSTNTFNVSSNTMSGANGSAITLQLGAPGIGSTVATSLSGIINSNTIGVTGVLDSGSQSGNGIFFSFADNTTAPKGVVTLLLTNNVIRQCRGNAGIYADNTGGNYNLNLTCSGNLVAEPGVGAFAGFAMAAGAPASSDDIDVFARITGNNFSTGDPANANDIIVGVSTGASSMKLAGTGGPADGIGFASLAAVQTFLLNNNNVAGTVVSAYTDAPATAANFLGAGATNPPLPP